MQDENSYERKLYRQDQLLSEKDQEIQNLTAECTMYQNKNISLEKQLDISEHAKEDSKRELDLQTTKLNHELMNSKLLISKIDLLTHGIEQLKKNYKNLIDKQIGNTQISNRIELDMISLQHENNQYEVQHEEKSIKIKKLESQLEQLSMEYQSETKSLKEKLEFTIQSLRDKDLNVLQQIEINNDLKQQIKEEINLNVDESIEQMEQEYSQSQDTDLIQTILNQQLKKIEDLLLVINQQNNRNLTQEQQIKQLNQDITKLQSISQVEVLEKSVLNALPAVMKNKFEYVQKITLLIPQFVDQITNLQIRFDSLETQTITDEQQLTQLQDQNTLMKKQIKSVEESYSKLKSEHEYLIKNTDQVLNDNWKLKKSLIDLCGRQKTLSILQSKSEDQDLGGFENLQELLDSFIKLKQTQLNRAQQWFEIL